MKKILLAIDEKTLEKAKEKFRGNSGISPNTTQLFRFLLDKYLESR